MIINWKVRAKNKNFWLAIIPAFFLLIQSVAAVFGFEIEFGALADKILVVVNSVFSVLAILGVVNDPTTKGFSDSVQAMGYEVPKS